LIEEFSFLEEDTYPSITQLRPPGICQSILGAPPNWPSIAPDSEMRGLIGCRFGRKPIVTERINHARHWLIDGVRSTSSAEVLETSALSCGLSLIMSLV
jgi:hypothetical protein